jgi:hypothetical protein
MEDNKTIIKELCSYNYSDTNKISIFKNKFKILSEKEQIYLIKYLFVTGKISYDCKSEIHNCFLDNKNIVNELFELFIGSDIAVTVLLENKKIPLDKSTYTELLYTHTQTFRRTGNGGHFYKIIKKYECEDMLFYTDVENIQNKDYNITEKDEIIKKQKEQLLQKDKEIDRLKLEIEEVKKFYINT